MSITRVFLIRHGATLLASEDRFAGATDVALAAAGEMQAQRLGARLASERLEAVYASPLARTMATAAAVAAPHGLAVISRPELREISHGRWETRTRGEVEALYPEEYARWQEDPFTFAPEGGESGLAVTARALPALLALVRAHPGARIAVVSHKATIRLLLSSLLGFDPRGYRDRLDQSPASLNVLDFKDPTRARLMLFNDTSHYGDRGGAICEPPQRRLSSWWDDEEDGSERG